MVASSLLGCYLCRRQIDHVRSLRDSTPSDFAASVPIEEHRRAADYTMASAGMAGYKALYDGAIGLAWLLLLLSPLYLLVSRFVEPGLTRSVAIVAIFAAFSEIADWPFAFHKTFGLDARFGMNRQTLRGFFVDRLKTGLLELVVSVPMLYGMFWAFRAFPEHWWLIAFAGFMLFVVGVTALYPTLIAPLFNEFTPLPNDDLRARLEALLQKCGFAARGLFVMDASKRSTRSNAYFAGFGKAKRIVLFDTLLARHTPDEIESILAHELGHYKFGHVKKMMLTFAVIAFLGFAALHWAMRPQGLAPAFGFASDPGVAFVVVLIALEPIMHLLSPLLSWRSRLAEFEADAFAKEMVGEAPMISALTRLTRDNLATLTPDRLYTLFYYSHPPVPVRIAHLRGAG
jgi:STE24 endopeptidase